MGGSCRGAADSRLGSASSVRKSSCAGTRVLLACSPDGYCVLQVQVRVEIVKLNKGAEEPEPDIENLSLDVNAAVCLRVQRCASSCPLPTAYMNLAHCQQHADA